MTANEFVLHAVFVAGAALFFGTKKSVIMWPGACFRLTEMWMTHCMSLSINLIYRRSEL